MTIAIIDSTLTMAIDGIESNTRLAESTKHQYRKAITNAVDAGVNLLDANEINAYSLTIGSSTKRFLSAAITALSRRLEHEAKSQATPENVAAIQATIYRAESLREAINVAQPKGTKAHTWLSKTQILELLNACEVTATGTKEHKLVAQRDRLAISLLVGAGLRRAEAVNLTFADVVTQHTATGTRYVLSVHGKGAKDRVVPISTALAERIEAWGDVVGGEGRVLRSLGRNRTPGVSMTTTALYNIVAKRGDIAGIDGLQPHDLRRTYAQIGYSEGVSVAQIGLLLGHESIETTMRYLNVNLDVIVTVSDFIPV